MSHTQRSNAVVLASRPTVSTLFKFSSFDAIPGDTNWSYAVFLRTTASGKRIEKFIPATGGPLFEYKIAFLRALLSRRPIFLQGAEEDVERLVVIADEICGQTKYAEISLKEQEQGQEAYVQIFGAPPIFNGQAVPGALAEMDVSGTLFIKHVERLSLATQQALVQFMTTGFYTALLPGKRLCSSNALIICSSEVDLKELVEAKAFSSELYGELTKNHLVFPSLSSLTEEQLSDLVRDISLQTFEAYAEPHGAELQVPSAEEILYQKRLKTKRPSSLCVLRQRVNEYLESRQPSKPLGTVISVSDGADDRSALVARAQRLGKKALKDKELLGALITVFKSCARVAELLNVDRATVFRWCKKHQIPVNVCGADQPGQQEKASVA